MPALPPGIRAFAIVPAAMGNPSLEDPVHEWPSFFAGIGPGFSIETQFP